jgi:hypothetical protein
MSETAESSKNLYSILKSKIDILSNWTDIPEKYKTHVKTFVYAFKALEQTDDKAIDNLYKVVIDFITTIPETYCPQTPPPTHKNMMAVVAANRHLPLLAPVVVPPKSAVLSVNRSVANAVVLVVRNNLSY